MKKMLPLMLAVAGSLTAGQAAAEEIYRDQHVRFTLIDDGTVRMEYAPDGQFVDNKSFVAVVRQYPNVKHTLKQTAKQVTITTDKMKLVYKKSDRPFDAQNLAITYNTGGVKGTWTPGTQQKANLKGTYRTLDGYSGDTNIWNHERIPLEDGLLARDGWTLIDDSKGLLFTEEQDGWDWVTKRTPNEGVDMYFMAYGHNYKEALKSYTKFAGNMPLPPRYTFGYWWSRYWSYSDQDFRTLIDNFHRLNIPLDVLVIDMDWHPISAEAGGGWTGWDWNERLFPDYKQFLSYLDEQGVKTTMNLHPADGVRPYEQKYAEFLQRYGRDANAKAALRQNDAPDGAVEWLGSDKQMVKALFETYLHPYMKEGVDFWWLDWQQWLTDKEMPELSNTWWCNYLFFTDMERNGDKRPLLYHRWGGLGNHRYQIGFSGDALMTWESLAFLPYFNSTASNVLYGYWSHDIGGHYNEQYGAGVVPEMYMRAMQMGQYLPVLRSHSTKDPSLNKEPWAFDNAMQERIVNTIKGRYELVPYIYTMARQANETGVSLCRPLYYEYPEAEEAYEFKSQYFFGDNMLIAPITQPADADGMVMLKLWLPEGEWYDVAKGELIYSNAGGTTMERCYSLDEFPVFVKGGSILPYYENAMNLGTNDQEMTIRVFPGTDDAHAQSGRATFELYEDNGEDNRYATEWAVTPLSYNRSGEILTLNIGAAKGHYDGMPTMRHYRLALPAAMPPATVKLNGKELPWNFDAQKVEVVIDLGMLDATKESVVEVVCPDSDALNGFKGKSHRILAAVADYKQRNAGLVYTEDFGTLENSALRLQYHPEEAPAILARFNAILDRLPAVLNQQMDNAEHEARFQRMLK